MHWSPVLLQFTDNNQPIVVCQGCFDKNPSMLAKAAPPRAGKAAGGKAQQQRVQGLTQKTGSSFYGAAGPSKPPPLPLHPVPSTGGAAAPAAPGAAPGRRPMRGKGQQRGSDSDQEWRPGQERAAQPRQQSRLALGGRKGGARRQRQQGDEEEGEDSEFEAMRQQPSWGPQRPSTRRQRQQADVGAACAAHCLAFASLPADTCLQLLAFAPASAPVSNLCCCRQAPRGSSPLPLCLPALLFPAAGRARVHRPAE